VNASWRRGLHPLIDERDVLRAVRQATGREPSALRQHQAKPPRVIYEALFEDRPPLIFKGELSITAQPHDIALEGWALEHAAIAGVSAPRLLAQDSSERDFPFRYLIMSKVEGVALEAVELTADQKQRVLTEAAAQLVRLHSVRTESYGLMSSSISRRPRCAVRRPTGSPTPSKPAGRRCASSQR
jgi:aminoglycoside phosphotransferase